MQAMTLDILKQCMRGEHTKHHNPCSSNCVRSDMFIESKYMRYGQSPGGMDKARYVWTWFPDYGCQCSNLESK